MEVWAIQEEIQLVLKVIQRRRNLNKVNELGMNWGGTWERGRENLQQSRR
jgi:hypothetical protein